MPKQHEGRPAVDQKLHLIGGRSAGQLGVRPPRLSHSSSVLTLIQRWGKREIIVLSLHCHHQNDSCITMGSDERHFNVSLIVRNKATRQCPQTTTFWKTKRRADAESSRGLSVYQLQNALPLGQNGSRDRAALLSNRQAMRSSWSTAGRALCCLDMQTALM